MGTLYPMYRTRSRRSRAVAAAAAAHLAARSRRLDGLARPVDDVPLAAERVQALPFGASRGRAVAVVVVERVPVVGDLLRAVCTLRRRERAAVDAAAGGR